MAAKIRKGDLVQVVSGADRGKQGRVLAVDPGRGKLRVERVRMQKRHLKPGRGPNRSGGIVEQEGYVDLSNVMLVEDGAPSRVRMQVVDGRRQRVFAKSGNPVPEPGR